MRIQTEWDRKSDPRVTLCRYLDGLDLPLYDSAMQRPEANFLAELERVVRGERPTVDPRALLFVAAEVILEGREPDDVDLQRIRTADVPSCNVIAFPTPDRDAARSRR